MKDSEKKKRFVALHRGEESTWMQEAAARQEAEGWRTKAAAIALQILRSLRLQKLTQKSLADRLGVAPQYVNRIVKGEENLTLDTITKIEQALGLPLLTIYVGEQRRVGSSVFPRITVNYHRADRSAPETVVSGYTTFLDAPFHYSA